MRSKKLSKADFFFVADSKYLGLDMLDNRFLVSFVKQNLSETCRRDTTSFLKSLNDFELWALKCEVKNNFVKKSFKYLCLSVFDASAKLPSGILNGNINQFGDFDQCLIVKSGNGKFQGKHCLATVQLKMSDNEEHFEALHQLLLSTEPYQSDFEDVSELILVNF